MCTRRGAAGSDRLVHRVIGCALTVHRALGPGFLESIYQKAMCFELEAQGIPFEREKPLVVMYRGGGFPDSAWTCS